MKNQNHRILVIEDQYTSDEELFKQIHQEYGFEIDLVKSIDEAKDIIDEYKNDSSLVIVDVRLKDDDVDKDTSGLGKLVKVNDIPVIVLTDALRKDGKLSQLVYKILTGFSDIEFQEKMLESETQRHLDEFIDTLISGRIKISLIFRESNTSNWQSIITPNILISDIGKYLLALEQIQNIIDDIREEPREVVKIIELSQNSPISISLEGAAEAAEIIRDSVTPWRKEHEKQMLLLEQQEKIANIEVQKAEVLEMRSRAQMNRSEANKMTSDIEHVKAEVEIERLKLENKKLHLEIEESRINLALKIIDRMASELSDSQKIYFVLQLLKPLEVITMSSLELINIETGNISR